MRQVVYSVAMSLDGYIAGPKGEYDWIVIDPEIDFGEMFRRYDTVLMGRKSYEASKAPGGYEMPAQKAYVFSTSLKQPDVPDATVSSDAKRTVTELKRARGKDIWLFGGGELFRSLLEQQLVDAVEVAVIPVLIGDGVRLLPTSRARASLVLTQQRLFKKTGTILLNYDVKYSKARPKAKGC